MALTFQVLLDRASVLPGVDVTLHLGVEIEARSPRSASSSRARGRPARRARAAVRRGACGSNVDLGDRRSVDAVTAARIEADFGGLAGDVRVLHEVRA